MSMIIMSISAVVVDVAVVGDKHDVRFAQSSWLRRLFAVQKFRKTDLDAKNEKVSFLQCIFRENPHA